MEEVIIRGLLCMECKSFLQEIALVDLEDPNCIHCNVPFVRAKVVVESEPTRGA